MIIPRIAAFAAATAIAALTTVFPSTARADGPLAVVATFSILGDMVEQIGGEHVQVTTLVGPNGDTHVYQPTPADARAVSEASVLVVNGLGFEGWLDRLIDASDFAGVQVVASSGIDPLLTEEHHEDEHDGHEEEHDGHEEEHDGHEEEHEGHEHEHEGHEEEHEGHEHEHEGHEHEHEGHDENDHGHAHEDEDEHHDGDDHAMSEGHTSEGGHDLHDHGEFDPHAWLSLDNAKIYVGNIAAGLTAADPENAAAYEANRARYVSEIDALDAEIRGLMAALPENRRTTVVPHSAFEYFGRDYGLTFLSPQGVSTEAEVSARDLAEIIQVIRDQDIRAVFVENMSDQRLLRRIADETGVPVGGMLYPGALSEPGGEAATYLEMMRHNAETLVSGLKP